MNRKKVYTGLVVTVTLICIIFYDHFYKNDLWDINANKLKDSFQLISGTSVIDDLSQWTPFEWDTIYSFAPYTSKEIIYDTIGYKWDKINESVNEGMNQIIFINEGKVVCYLYGYPFKDKLGFNFGPYDGYYTKISNDQSLMFKTTYDEEIHVRYFAYIFD